MTGPITTSKETIGVFFGGKSPEHDVSIVTGELIFSGVKKLG
jgi:D-alanine-D-alanine ligase-like ATP-grasp enzyme